MDTKICSRCRQEKYLSEFSKHSNKKDGLQSMCRDCWRDYRPKNPRKKDDVPESHISLVGLTNSEWCKTYLFLSKMGYNAFGDIHDQFVKRHQGLVYKRRPRRNYKTVPPENCSEYLK